MSKHSYYKNDRKLNGEWMRLYTTNKCKTCPVKNICIQNGVKEIFEPVDDLGLRINVDFQTTEGKICYKKRTNLNEAHFDYSEIFLISKN